MSRARVVWIVGAAVAAAAVLAVALVWLTGREGGPDATAQRFLDALASGDGDAALGLIESPPGGIDAAAAYAGVSETLSDPEVVSVAQDGADAAAVVRFTLDGESREAELSLVQVDDGWHLRETALGRVDATADLGDAVTIGDAGTAFGPAALLPGVYAVRASPTDVLSGETTVVVLPGATDAIPAAVDADLRPDAVTRAQAQLEAYATACAQPAAEVAQACGFRIPWSADLATLDAVTYRVVQVPAVAIDLASGTFEATGGRIVATVSGTARDGSAASLTYRDEAWSLRGVVRIDDAGLTLGVL